MKDSEILKQARRRVAACECEFICHALIAEETRETRDQCRALREWISSMLEDCCALEYWLKCSLPEPKLTFSDINADPAKLRNTRLAWLDWMIAYCEAEECGVSPAACFAHAHVMVRGGE